MEAQAVKKKVGTAAATTGSKGVVGRMRAAIAESAWGPLVGKGALAVAGFVVLALVGSGRIGGSGGRIGIAEAAAATVSASASAAIMAAPAASSSASATTTATATATTTTTGGGETVDAGAGDGGDAGAAVTAEGKVAINRANEQDLRRLPGIGATRAKAILALRERLGRFRRPEDLLRVKGIGRRMLGRLRPLLIIEP
jgi:competence protein ComEA